MPPFYNPCLLIMPTSTSNVFAILDLAHLSLFFRFKKFYHGRSLKLSKTLSWKVSENSRYLGQKAICQTKIEMVLVNQNRFFSDLLAISWTMFSLIKAFSFQTCMTLVKQCVQSTQLRTYISFGSSLDYLKFTSFGKKKPIFCQSFG